MTPLERLHANGHPLGVADASALAAGRLPPSLDPRLARVLSGCPDVAAALNGCLPAAARATAHGHTLRAAGTWPLVLATSVALSGSVLVGAAGTALPLLPLGQAGGFEPGILAAWGLGVALLLLLAGAVLGGFRIPLLGRGWERIEGFVFLELTRALLAAGLSAPAAARAAATWCAAPARRGGEALARALEAGHGTPDLGPLLHPFEARLLLSAAAAGALADTLEALAEQRSVALDREIPGEALRIEVVAVVLAGLALLAVAVRFFDAYWGALA